MESHICTILPRMNTLISLDGNDWTYKQHQKIETIPTEDDFRDVVKEYLSWKVSMIMKEDMPNEN